MKKTYILLFFLAVFVFSGCSLSGTSSQNSEIKKNSNFLKSVDGGKTWENKVSIDETKNIGLANILSIAVDPKESGTVYLGTEKEGLFVTRNGAEKWEKVKLAVTKVYGVTINPNENKTIYVSGLYGKRAKIFKTENGGADWKEVYSEPSDSTVISSLEINKKDPRILYCGTSEGMVFKSSDGGQSWENLYKANGPVVEISFDSENSKVVYFGVFKQGIIRTMDGGEKMEELSKIDIKKFVATGESINWNSYSLVADPQIPGVFYAGMEKGLLRASDFGNKIEKIEILESSKKFPIRAVAINPKNSNDIVYSNAGVIYRSLDRGVNWSTFQLNTESTAEVIKFDNLNPGVLYAGLRKM